MSVPVSTTVEVFGKPAEYKSGEMNAMAGDGERKVAFITGTTGQDGSYLVELLLSKGYIVHGIKRRSSSYNHPRLEHIMEDGACGVTNRPSSRTRVCPRPQIAPDLDFSPDAPRSAPARRRGSRRAPPVFPSYSV